MSPNGNARLARDQEEIVNAHVREIKWRWLLLVLLLFFGLCAWLGWNMAGHEQEARKTNAQVAEAGTKLADQLRVICDNKDPEVRAYATKYHLCEQASDVKSLAPSINAQSVEPIPVQTIVLPGEVRTTYATSVQTVPGPTLTIPGPTIPGPKETVQVPMPAVTETYQFTAPPEIREVQVPGPEVQVPGPETTVTVTETVPGPTTTETVTVPGPETTITVTATETVAGPVTTETVNVPGPETTITEPGPTVTVTVTETVNGGGQQPGPPPQ